MGADIIRAIQSIATPFWDVFFNFASFLGEELFFALVITAWYWCVDKTGAVRTAWVLFLSVAVNGALKVFFDAPRPVGVEKIRSLRLETATGRSFPSGHTQNITTFLCTTAGLLRRKWFYGTAALVVLLVGLSRLYLGLHWPLDVAGGLFFGLVCAITGNLIFDWIERSGRTWPVWLLAGAVLAGLALTREADYWKAAGMLAGFTAGWRAERRFIGFKVEASLPRQLMKWLIGVGGFLALQQGLKLISGDWLPAHCLRYALAGFWVMAGAPFVFVRMGLSEPEPG
jgi:membrane-associated phospholipid phosphatase